VQACLVLNNGHEKLYAGFVNVWAASDGEIARFDARDQIEKCVEVGDVS
jgi:hypothetical protein